MKHTPGPWIAECSVSKVDPAENEFNVVFPGIDASANATQKSIDRFVIATVNGYYFGSHTLEPEANARLLAAAPELLAALVDICALDAGSTLRDDRNALCQAVERARKVLAKVGAA